MQDNQAVYRGDMAKLHLDYTLITAPIDGIVGNRRSRSGAYAFLANRSPLVVDVRVGMLCFFNVDLSSSSH